MTLSCLSGLLLPPLSTSVSYMFFYLPIMVSMLSGVCCLPSYLFQGLDDISLLQPRGWRLGFVIYVSLSHLASEALGTSDKPAHSVCQMKPPLRSKHQLCIVEI